MKSKTFRPTAYTMERLERIRQTLQSARPEREQSLSAALNYSLWYMDELIKSGKLTQVEIAIKPEGKAS